jgi:dihydropteroate synthase
VRVHDVRETVAALKVWGATQSALAGHAGSKT